VKKRTEDAYPEYLAACTQEQQDAAADFFQRLDRQLQLSSRENRRIRADFEKGLAWYTDHGVAFEEALSRLDPVRLGGFYARGSVLWYPLDSAAKVYPLSMKQGEMAVFRLSVYLREPVVPELLQLALTFTVRRFPGFATTVKKGFFWHYLDSWKGRYPVREEQDRPCRAMKVGRTGANPFRVRYYGNRISIEFFHLLTDGVGGMVFLKTLTAEYLRLLGVTSRPGHGVLELTEPASPEESVNEFPRALQKSAAAGFSDKGALQLGGKRSRVNPCRVLRFCMDADALRAQAAKRDVTVTAYLVSRVLWACRCATEDVNGDLSVQVPVNMRKYYPSQTLRNFAMYFGVRLPAGEIRDPDALLPAVKAQMAEKSSRENMDKMVASTQNLVRLARFLPLVVKAPVVQAVYGVLGDRIFTTTLSNLGRVTLPPELEHHIKSMDFVLGSARVNRVMCSAVTFGVVASLCIAKQTTDPTFEEALLAALEKDGLQITVEGSPYYED